MAAFEGFSIFILLNSNIAIYYHMNETSSSPVPSVSGIAPEEIAAQANALLLDVRTPAEFEEMHIAGSVLRPLAGLDADEIARLATDKESCVLICRSGGRASQAAKRLESAGLPSLRVLEGGVRAWEAAGLPLNRGRKSMSLERQVRIAAGSLVLVGALLALLVHPAWMALAAFVGAGLVFAGVTDTCGLALLIARMPWNRRPSPDASCCSLPR